MLAFRRAGFSLQQTTFPEKGSWFLSTRPGSKICAITEKCILVFAIFQTKEEIPGSDRVPGCRPQGRKILAKILEAFTRT